MTVTYSLSMSSVNFAGFGKLLLRWKGGIYALVWRELLLFSFLYYLVFVIYRFALNESQQRSFEHVAVYCRDIVDLIPITFAMGFYVNLVVTRWWDQYINLPWIDRCCVLIGAYVVGDSHYARLVRRNLARYLTIMGVLTLSNVSASVKRRFPNMDSVVEAGIMTKEEKELMNQLPTTHGAYYYPVTWFSRLAMKARQLKLIKDDNHLVSLLAELNNFRSNCGMLLSYDWVSIPLVYTQVVSIAVYFFFIACLFGRQHLIHDVPGYKQSYSATKYFPFFTYLQFLFFMGWLKCAEQLINPLGDDDEDFEVNYLIDRNIRVGFTLVDYLTGQEPTLIMDRFAHDRTPVFDDVSEEANCAGSATASPARAPGDPPPLQVEDACSTNHIDLLERRLSRRKTVPWFPSWRSSNNNQRRSIRLDGRSSARKPFTIM